MKRILKICLYTIALVVAVFMVGCKGDNLPVDDGKLKIVTTRVDYSLELLMKWCISLCCNNMSCVLFF